MRVRVRGARGREVTSAEKSVRSLRAGPRARRRPAQESRAAGWHRFAPRSLRSSFCPETPFPSSPHVWVQVQPPPPRGTVPCPGRPDLSLPPLGATRLGWFSLLRPETSPRPGTQQVPNPFRQDVGTDHQYLKFSVSPASSEACPGGGRRRARAAWLCGREPVDGSRGQKRPLRAEARRRPNTMKRQWQCRQGDTENSRQK